MLEENGIAPLSRDHSLSVAARCKGPDRKIAVQVESVHRRARTAREGENIGEL